MIQALVKQTTGPRTFGMVDGRGEKVVYVTKDIGVGGSVEA